VGRPTEAGKTASKREVVRSVDVTLPYLDDCPNWQLADQRLRDALALAGRDDVQVERRLVVSPKVAEARALSISPYTVAGSPQGNLRQDRCAQPGRIGRTDLSRPLRNQMGGPGIRDSWPAGARHLLRPTLTLAADNAPNRPIAHRSAHIGRSKWGASQIAPGSGC
jgi:hypothetical protein